MSFPARFNRPAWLSITIVVWMVTIGSFQLLKAQINQSLSETERGILETLERGESADLLGRQYQTISGRFLAELIANRGAHFSFPNGISLSGVRITGNVSVIGANVPF